MITIHCTDCSLSRLIGEYIGFFTIFFSPFSPQTHRNSAEIGVFGPGIGGNYSHGVWEHFWTPVPTFKKSQFLMKSDFFNIDHVFQPNVASPGKTTMFMRTGLQKRSRRSSQTAKSSILEPKRLGFHAFLVTL